MHFAKGVKDYNSQVFGNIFWKKKRLIARLQGIENKLSIVASAGLLDLQHDLWKEYEEVLAQEEIL